jgi:hypothetical protein
MMLLAIGLYCAAVLLWDKSNKEGDTTTRAVATVLALGGLIAMIRSLSWAV